MKAAKRIMTLTLALVLLLATVSSVFADDLWKPYLDRRNPDRQAVIREKYFHLIKQDHPRIFITGEDDIQRIKERIAADPVVLGPAYAQMKKWAYEVVNLHPTNYEVVPRHFEALTLVYLLEDRDEVLLEKIQRNLWDYINRDWAHYVTNRWWWPPMARGLSIVYDWVYEDLNKQTGFELPEGVNLLEETGKFALKFAQQTYTTYAHSDYNNQLYIFYYTMIYPGLALMGEGINDEAAEQLILDVAEMIEYHGIPTRNQVGAGEYPGKGDGGWHESVSYMAFNTYHFAQAVEAWSAATGVNFWEGLYGMDGDPEYYYHVLNPHDGNAAIINNTGAFKLNRELVNYMPLLVSRRNSRTAAGMMELLIKGIPVDPEDRPIEVDRIWDHDWVATVLWHDPSVEPIYREELHTSRYFRGIGQVAMRSSWERDATFAMFMSQPYYSGHQHSHANSFYIAKKGILAHDPTGNIKLSTAHNTVNIGNGQRLFGNDPVRFYEEIEGTIREFGKILAYVSKPEYTYALGDATKAYDESEGVLDYSRHFVYLNPDTFIVFDKVVTADAATPKEWLLQTVNPAVKIDDNNFIVTEGEGQLHVQSLLPLKKTAVTKVTDGRNAISIMPAQDNNTEFFLHVLTAGNKGDEIPEPAVIEDNPGRTVVTLTRGQLTYTVSFLKNVDKKPAVTIKIEDQNGKVILNDNMIALSNNGKYVK